MAASQEQEQAGRSRMHATLIRFGPELLRIVRDEAKAEGVSVAQYVREAVLVRIAYNNGRRGDHAYDGALEEIAGTSKGTRLREAIAENRRLRTEKDALLAENAQARSQNARLRGDRREA